VESVERKYLPAMTFVFRVVQNLVKYPHQQKQDHRHQ